MAFTACPLQCQKPARCALTSDEDQELIRGINSLRNKYSVISTAVGRPVEVHAYAERIVIRQNGAVVAEHPRCFGRFETIYDPWHYVPVLARKPGALRNGAPFRDWVLPAAMAAIRRKLKGVSDGDKQMVSILGCVSADGIAAVEAACKEALDQGVRAALEPMAVGPHSPPRSSSTFWPEAAICLHPHCFSPQRRCVWPMNRSLIARATTASGGPTHMERTPSPAVLGPMANHGLALDLMSSLKLYGMRSAYDEVMASGIKRQHEPRPASSATCCNPRLPRSSQRVATGSRPLARGPVDPLPAHHRKAATGEGSG